MEAKGKGKKGNIKAREEEEILKLPDMAPVAATMEAALAALERDLAGLRTGRASPGLLENLPLKVYEETQPLRHVATVAARDARTLTVSLHDPELTQAVEKAIHDSPLGLTARAEERGQFVVPVPPLTSEQRAAMAKLAAVAAEKVLAMTRTRPSRTAPPFGKDVGAVVTQKTHGLDKEGGQVAQQGRRAQGRAGGPEAHR